MVDVLARTAPAGEATPGRRRACYPFRRRFGVWRLVHWRPLVAGWKISLLVLVGVSLGVALLGGMLVMYHATSDPFASQTALAGDVGAVQVTPWVQYGLTEDSFEVISDATGGAAVPVVDGLTQIEGSSGARVGVLLVGSDCRIEDFVGDFDCARLLEEMEERGGSPSEEGGEEGVRLAVSPKTAAALGLAGGDRVGFPGGRVGEAVVGRVVGEEEVSGGSLGALNNGYWAVGSVPGVQDLLRVGPHLSRVLVDEDVELPDEVADVAAVGASDAGIGAFLRLNLQMLLIIASLGLIGSMLIAGNTYALAIEIRRRQLALVSVVGMAPRRMFVGLVGEGALLGAVAGVVATVPAWLLGDWLARSWGRDLLSGIGAAVEVPVWLWWLPFLCAGAGMAVGALAAVPAAWRLNHSNHSGLLRGEVQTTMLYRARRIYWFIPVGVGLLGSGLVAGWLWGRGEIGLLGGVAGAVSLALGCVVLTFGATPAVMLGFEWVFARGRAAAMLTASDLATDPLRWSTVVVVAAGALMVGVGFNALRYMSVDSLIENTTSEMGKQLFLHPRKPGEAAFARFDEASVDRIRAVPGVAGVSPQYLAIVELGGASLNVMATDPSEHRDNLTFDSGTDSEAVWAELADDEDSILVSSQVARRYDLTPGDTWVLPTVAGPHEFRIAAVADARFAEDNGIGPWIVVSADSIGKWWGVANPHLLVVTPGGETSTSELAPRLAGLGVVRLSVLEPAGVRAIAESNGDRYVAPGERVGWVMVAFAAAAVAVFLLLALAQREHRRTLLRWIGYRRSLEWLNLFTEIAVVLVVAYVFGIGGAWALDWFMSLASPSLLASRVDWAVVPESLVAGVVAAVLIGVVAVTTTWSYAAQLDKVLNARALGGRSLPLKDWPR